MPIDVCVFCHFAAELSILCFYGVLLDLQEDDIVVLSPLSNEVSTMLLRSRDMKAADTMSEFGQDHLGGAALDE